MECEHSKSVNLNRTQKPFFFFSFISDQASPETASTKVLQHEYTPQVKDGIFLT